MMNGWHSAGIGFGVWLLMGLFWLVLLGLVVWAVVRLLPASRTESRPVDRDGPEEILDRRFARGEIDLDTYQAQRAALAQARGERTGREGTR
jgi:putative membrane protein